MNIPIILKLCRTDGCPSHRDAIQIDGPSGRYQNARRIKPPTRRTGGFSLVEVAIALGVAAISLIVLMGLLPAGLKTQQNSAEQTVANGVMTEILGDLRADLRLPPGQVSKEDANNGGSGFGLHGHWAQVRTPDVLYFTNEGKWTGTLNAGSPTPDAALRAKITYLFPPSASTSVAKIIVSWPPQIDPTAPGAPVPAGFVETFIAVNR
jgi:type II secretory pathway pseudopilin PulG